MNDIEKMLEDIDRLKEEATECRCYECKVCTEGE